MFNLQTGATYEWELHVCWYLLTCDTAGPELLSLQHFSTFIYDSELKLSSSEPSKSTVTDLLLHWWQSQDIKRWLPSSICHQFHVGSQRALRLSDGGIKPCFPFLRNVSVREKDESPSHRFLWLLRLFRSTRLRLNPEPESEIWPIKSCFLQAADLMNKLFTVTAGKLRRCPVREAQREFNPNRFSSWFLAQVRLINY